MQCLELGDEKASNAGDDDAKDLHFLTMIIDSRSATSSYLGRAQTDSSSDSEDEEEGSLVPQLLSSPAPIRQGTIVVVQRTVSAFSTLVKLSRCVSL